MQKPVPLGSTQVMAAAWLLVIQMAIQTSYQVAMGTEWSVSVLVVTATVALAEVVARAAVARGEAATRAAAVRAAAARRRAAPPHAQRSQVQPSRRSHPEPM